MVQSKTIGGCFSKNNILSIKHFCDFLLFHSLKSKNKIMIFWNFNSLLRCQSKRIAIWSSEWFTQTHCGCIYCTCINWVSLLSEYSRLSPSIPSTYQQGRGNSHTFCGKWICDFGVLLKLLMSTKKKTNPIPIRYSISSIHITKIYLSMMLNSVAKYYSWWQTSNTKITSRR